MNSKEKIRQFVIMARHPEAKDFDEALRMESKFDDCKILYQNTECKILHNHKDGLFIYYYPKEPSGSIGKVFATRKEYQILGRPITASDVCWALNKKQSEHYYFAIDNGIWCGDKLKDRCSGIVVLVFEFETKKQDGSDIFLTEWEDDVCDKINACYINN